MTITVSAAIPALLTVGFSIESQMVSYWSVIKLKILIKCSLPSGTQESPPPTSPLRIAAAGWGQQEGCSAHAHSPGHQKLGTNTRAVIRTLFFESWPCRVRRSEIIIESQMVSLQLIKSYI